MISAVDTNVVVALLAGTEAEAAAAERALTDASKRGVVVICGAVYAELMALPGLGEGGLDSFLQETQITVDWALEREVWQQAGRAYLAYAEQRRRQKGDPGPRRILADFLIGAHASLAAGRLLTLDPQLFRANFGGLELIVPEPG